jgi:oxygen-independent coproporphyrinogen-3 oxidase
MRFVDQMAEKVASTVHFAKVEDVDSVLPERLERAGLNIRVPFCASRCTYCALPGEVYNRKGADQFLSGLNREIELYSSRFHDVKVERIYFSGGTPSLLHGDIGGIVESVKEHFDFDGSVAMEAAPSDLDTEVLDSLHSAGVNQLSIGVQTFQESTLTMYLGRKSTRSDLISTLELAVRTGFDYVNIDLMFSLPGQTKESLADDLETAVATGVQGISTYPLMLLPYTPLTSKLGKGQSNHSGTSKSDPFAQSPVKEKEQYLQIVGFLRDHGYRLRTLWSFSKDPEKYEGPYEHSDFVGMGPRAWGMLSNRFTLNVSSTASYVKSLGEGRIPILAYSEVRDYPLARFARRLYYGKIDREELDVLKAQDRQLRKYVSLMRLLGLIVKEGEHYVLSDRALAYGSHATKKIAMTTLMRINEELGLAGTFPFADDGFVKVSPI